MTITGFDTWGEGPSPAAAKNAGMVFHTWYSSYDTSKDGPTNGPADYAAEGIWSVCNFETTTDRVITGGYAGGQQDMMHAINEFVPRGMPVGAAVILSADEAIPASSFPQALAYYQGAHQAAAGQYLTGCYGEQALIAYLKQHGAIEIGWRTMSTAWPGGTSSAYCDLIQTGPGSIGGVDVDLNEALVPFFGQWMPGKLYSAQEDIMAIGLDDLEAIAQWIENRKVGQIPDQAQTTTLGVETASSPARWAQLFAQLGELAAAVKQLGTPSVDANALAAALAGNPAFVEAIAVAVVSQLGTDLSRTTVHPIGGSTVAAPTS